MSARITGLVRDPRVRRVAQIAIGFLLGWAAIAKLGAVDQLAQQVHRFQLVPVGAENLLAMVIPWIELSAAVCLVTGWRGRGGATVAIALLAVFTVAVGSAMARGLDFECGCFGTSGATRVGWPKLLENLGMLALGVVGVMPARAPEVTTSNEP